MRIKRAIIGVLVGLIAGIGLEYINAFLTFLMPPFLVLLPLAMLIGGCIGAVVKGSNRTHLIGDSQSLRHLPIRVAEFIKLVIKKMRYRREVRADVRAELTAHFEDELKECKTQAEKEQKAEQVIAGFGDAKLLAVLLRRAKKRCRPLWRAIFARACQAVVLSFICLILYGVWFFSGKPVITTDYIAELNRIVRPTADDNLNAAPLYNKAAKLYENLPDDISKLLSKKHAEVTAEEKQLIKKWLTDNQETLELMRLTE